jgi:Holliday junction resolvase RusA-like endonuclease
LITLTLPLSPSANNLTFNVGNHGRAHTKTYRDWIENADAAYYPQKRGTKPVTGPYTVHISVPQNMKGDADNRAKAILDWLVRLELTPDDKHCQKVTVERWHMVEEGQCIVVVKPHMQEAA